MLYNYRISKKTSWREDNKLSQCFKIGLGPHPNQRPTFFLASTLALANNHLSPFGSLCLWQLLCVHFPINRKGAGLTKILQGNKYLKMMIVFSKKKKTNVLQRNWQNIFPLLCSGQIVQSFSIKQMNRTGFTLLNKKAKSHYLGLANKSFFLFSGGNNLHTTVTCTKLYHRDFVGAKGREKTRWKTKEKEINSSTGPWSTTIEE